MSESLLDQLLATDDPAEKAAIVAESYITDLDDPVATVARRCIILHWFDEVVVEALLGDCETISAEQVYGELTALPFVENLPWGLAYHELTCEGLLKRYGDTQTELLIEAAALAAPAYLRDDAGETKAAEALYCYVVAGDKDKALALLDTLLLQAGSREDWQTFSNLLEKIEEAEFLPFAEMLPRSALHFVAWGIAHKNKGDLDDAIQDYNQAILLNPEYANAYSNLGTLLRQQKDWSQAQIAHQKATALDPTRYIDWTALADLARRTADEPGWQAALARARPYLDESDHYNAACFESIAGNVDKSLDLLAKDIATHPGMKTWAKQDPDLEWIRDDPRFWEIMDEE